MLPKKHGESQVNRDMANTNTPDRNIHWTERGVAQERQTGNRSRTVRSRHSVALSHRSVLVAQLARIGIRFCHVIDKDSCSMDWQVQFHESLNTLFGHTSFGLNVVRKVVDEDGCYL